MDFLLHFCGMGNESMLLSQEFVHLKSDFHEGHDLLRLSFTDLGSEENGNISERHLFSYTVQVDLKHQLEIKDI